MIAFWIGVFFLLQFITLAFVLVLCKSAAMADREFERALAREYGQWSQTPVRGKHKRIKSKEELQISTDIIH